MMTDPVNVVSARIADLSIALDDVPDDGSGVDPGWNAEVPAPDREHDWIVFTNSSGDEIEVDGPGEHTHSIPPYRMTVWYGTHLISPVMMVHPHGGQQLVAERGEFADISAEDAFIQDVERYLAEELDYHDFDPIHD